MRRRYRLCLRHAGIDRTTRAALLELAAAEPSFTVAIDEPRLIVVAEVALPVRAVGPHCVIGNVFGRAAAAGGDQCPAVSAGELIASLNHHAMDGCWGSYVAVRRYEGGQCELVRAPFGDLGCYYIPRSDGVDVSSDAALLRTLGVAPVIDWPALVRYLMRSEIVGSETCLTGLRELRGGDCVTLHNQHHASIAPFWSPWRFVDQPIGDRAEAAEIVHRVARRTCATLTASFDHVLLMLSGGLDSSIVAACLGRQPTTLTCMTLVTADAAGDERHYAQLAADAAGARLLIVPRDASLVDLRCSAASRLPRPMARSFTQDSERNAAMLAGTEGAAAVIDGGGGDNVFCSHRSVAAVADELILGHWRQAGRTASALADLADASLLTVLARAARRAWGSRLAAPHADGSLLLPSVVAAAGPVEPHPWLAPPIGTLPGKALHVALLAVAQAMVEAGEAPGEMPFLSPLVAQPLVECCLSIPSRFWFAPGRDRAAAHDAFATNLPPAIVGRRSKGVPNLYAASLIEHHRSVLRDLLLDGVLAAQGIIDRQAIRAMLDDEAPARNHGFTRLLQLADAEAWVRVWV